MALATCSMDQLNLTGQEQDQASTLVSIEVIRKSLSHLSCTSSLVNITLLLAFKHTVRAILQNYDSPSLSVAGLITLMI